LEDDVTVTNARLANAFHPGAEIDDPDSFAGRSYEIEEVAKALNTEGSCPIIYGDRGLGKSSLALQTWLIAQGDDRLLRRHGLEGWRLADDDAFLAFYVPCTDSTSTTARLLERVGTSLSSVQLDSRAERLVDRTTTRGISLRVFSAESTRHYERLEKQLIETTNIEDRLVARASALTECFGRRVLVILDELDRVRETKGLASFIKSNTATDLKFMLVGIAQNVSALLNDHLSLERKAHPIEVRRMTTGELKAIMTSATDELREEGVSLEFSPEAATLLADRASGFPWFVHVIGQEALLKVASEGKDRIERKDVGDAVARLTRNRFAQQFSDQYQKAVQDSQQRELVLRSFASWKGRDIPTADVYRVLKTRLGVSNPSIYKGHLLQNSYGRVLLTPPQQPRGLVRFTNEMFKIYVRLRSSLYLGADDRVTNAFLKSDE
jgi:Cdc6-like AAA superfamily ATPase